MSESRSMQCLDDLCISWGEEILRDKELGWKIKWTADKEGNSEGIALFKTKTICIHWPKGESDYPLMLHEIAHAVTGEGHGHDSFFAHTYMRLVEEYFTPNVLVDDPGKRHPQERITKGEEK